MRIERIPGSTSDCMQDTESKVNRYSELYQVKYSYTVSIHMMYAAIAINVIHRLRRWPSIEPTLGE